MGNGFKLTRYVKNFTIGIKNHFTDVSTRNDCWPFDTEVQDVATYIGCVAGSVGGGALATVLGGGPPHIFLGAMLGMSAGTITGLTVGPYVLEGIKAIPQVISEINNVERQIAGGHEPVVAKYRNNMKDYIRN